MITSKLGALQVYQLSIPAPPPPAGSFDAAAAKRGDIGAAAEKDGFGFGKKGTAAGRFYDFPQSPASPPVAIKGNTPK